MAADAGGLVKLPEQIFFDFAHPGKWDGQLRHHKIGEEFVPALDFCRDWLAGRHSFPVQSSGSTGEPRTISLPRKIMEESARRTLDHFHLQPGMTVFNPLGSHSIAGKMMMVRAMVGGLVCTLLKPSTRIGADIPDGYRADFAAMLPLQLHALLEETEAARIEKAFPIILLGGGPISHELSAAARTLKSQVWHGYGMTESASHIALRRVNGDEKSDDYSPLPGIRLRLSEDQRLIVTGDQDLITNDIAEILPTGTFRILGRADDAINSGGLKIHPESLEAELFSFLPGTHNPQNFCLSSLPDAALGEKCVLVTTSSSFTQHDFKDWILRLRQQKQLNRNLLPKALITVHSFPFTSNGKLRRSRLRSDLSEMDPQL